jgi:hypothetical protein
VDADGSRLYDAGMIQKKLRLALGAALVLWALAPMAPARACSCAVAAPPAAMAAAVAVFEGVLVRQEDSGGENVATFQVHRVWKGDVAESYSVRALGPQSMCPPHFTVGERYIVYVTAAPDGPRIQQCSRYARAEQLASERAALGRPIRTYPAR